MKLAHPSARYSESCLTMVNRPPKPPCWRDFIPEGKSRSSRESGSLYFTDLSQLSNKATASQDSINLGIGSTSSETTHAHTAHTHALTLHSHGHLHTGHSVPPVGKSLKKHKNKLHRTRSEISIGQNDLPEMSMTVTLAETKPREFGLRRTQFDAQSYIEDNTRRCERWLEDLRASQPLDDVHFAQGSGVEVEIPDEESSISSRMSETLADIDSVSMASSLQDGGQRQSRARHRDHHKHRIFSQTAQKPNIDSIAEQTETKDHSGQRHGYSPASPHGEHSRPPDASDTTNKLLSLFSVLSQPSFTANQNSDQSTSKETQNASSPNPSDLPGYVKTSDADSDATPTYDR